MTNANCAPPAPDTGCQYEAEPGHERICTCPPCAMGDVRDDLGDVDLESLSHVADSFGRLPADAQAELLQAAGLEALPNVDGLRRTYEALQAAVGAREGRRMDSRAQPVNAIPVAVIALRGTRGTLESVRLGLAAVIRGDDLMQYAPDAPISTQRLAVLHEVVAAHMGVSCELDNVQSWLEEADADA